MECEGELFLEGRLGIFGMYICKKGRFFGGGRRVEEVDWMFGD